MGEAGMAIDLGGTTTEFAYGAGGMALEKQGGTYTQAHTVGNGLLRRGSEYPLFDGHGSERTVTNSSQTVTGSVNFEAFGQVAGSTGSSSNPYMYAGDWGYRNDGDAGLMHVGARYYDAQVGRFITRDTVLSEHPYLYCEHEPVGFVDPSGHEGVWDWIKGKGRIAADGFGGIVGGRPPISDIRFRGGKVGAGPGAIIGALIMDTALDVLVYLVENTGPVGPSTRSTDITSPVDSFGQSIVGGRTRDK
jgi:RHS repeat-associated protein